MISRYNINKELTNKYFAKLNKCNRHDLGIAIDHLQYLLQATVEYWVESDDDDREHHCFKLYYPDGSSERSFIRFTQKEFIMTYGQLCLLCDMIYDEKQYTYDEVYNHLSGYASSEPCCDILLQDFERLSKFLEKKAAMLQGSKQVYMNDGNGNIVSIH